MKYDFDKIVDRRHTNSLKWDVAEGELPMWVADMDFETAPGIRKAVEERAAQGVFGYAIDPDNWANSYINWWKKRHDFTMQKEWLMFCTGVVPAISSIVRKITTPAEKVLIQTPVYNIFFNSILNNGRQVLESRLEYDGVEYHINWEDLESKLADPQTSLMILCNPHNPVGKIWDRETLARIGELCSQYHVVVLSDEIHCDLTDPGYSYIPFASVSETCRNNSITCMAPTKTFSIAGLQTAAVSVPEPFLRHKVWRGLNTDEVAEGNVFAAIVAVAAFETGEEWLDELREYLLGNKQLVVRFVTEKIPQIKVLPSKATYLLWLNVSSLGYPSVELCEKIREKTGLYLSEGEEFGGDGKDWLRMNIACPRSVVEEGLNRLKTAVEEIAGSKQ